VVLAHGFAADQSLMATLARRIARAGYAVLTFDFRGHGRNPQPLERLLEGRGGLVEDVHSVVSYVRAHPRLDGSRIAVAGHSMGGGAAMRYASYESGLGCVIGISGGMPPEGPYPVQNLLLVWAEGDPALLRVRMRDLGAEQSRMERLVLDRTYGDPRRGEGLHLSEVSGADHITILYSSAAAARILDWLAVTLGPGEHARDDPLAGGAGGWVALGLVAALVLFWGLPAALGPLFGSRVSSETARPLRSFGLFALALVGAVVLLYPTTTQLGPGPAGLIPITVGRELSLFFAISGVLYWVMLAHGGGVSRPARPLASDVAAALLLFGAVYLLLGGVLAPYIELGLSPRRVSWAGVSTALSLPFFVASERALRGPGWLGTWLPIAAKLLLVITLAAAALAGLLPCVLLLALGAIGALFVLLEGVAQRMWRAGFDARATALFQALWIGQLASSFPFDA
jgi:dienelactone hydrolase